MEPCFEYRWAYWHEAANRFEQTPIWMTDGEARADFWAYDDPRSYRIEHTKRDRKRTSGPLVEPPDSGIDWTRERRKRAEVSRYKLPPFFTPTYGELRLMWTKHRDEDFRRVALEVQTDRHEFRELLALTAEEHFQINKEGATIEEARKAIARIRRRLHQIKERIGPLTGDD